MRQFLPTVDKTKIRTNKNRKITLGRMTAFAKGVQLLSAKSLRPSADAQLTAVFSIQHNRHYHYVYVDNSLQQIRAVQQ